MDEERLKEIEDLFDLVENMDPAEREYYWEAVVQAQQELITRIRRLRAAAAPGGAIYEQAYSNGESNGLADIFAIIEDPHDPNDILGEIKGYLGMGHD